MEKRRWVDFDRSRCLHYDRVPSSVDYYLLSEGIEASKRKTIDRAELDGRALLINPVVKILIYSVVILLLLLGVILTSRSRIEHGTPVWIYLVLDTRNAYQIVEDRDGQPLSRVYFTSAYCWIEVGEFRFRTKTQYDRYQTATCVRSQL